MHNDCGQPTGQTRLYCFLTLKAHRLTPSYSSNLTYLKWMALIARRFVQSIGVMWVV